MINKRQRRPQPDCAHKSSKHPASKELLDQAAQHTPGGLGNSEKATELEQAMYQSSVEHFYHKIRARQSQSA